VVGAVVGLGLMRGGRDIDWRLVGSIAGGWVITPLISGVVCFVALFFLQNVFNQQVYREVHYVLSEPVFVELAEQGVDSAALKPLEGREFRSARAFVQAVDETGFEGPVSERTLLGYAKLNHIYVNPEKFSSLDRDWLSSGQISAIERLHGREFTHGWQLARVLAADSPDWAKRESKAINKLYNKELDKQLEYVYRGFAGLPDRR
jgi:PiT family inorganic phosphate transporter